MRELVAVYRVVVRRGWRAVGVVVVASWRLLREARVRRGASVCESRCLLSVAGRAGDVDAAASLLLLGRVRGPVGRGVVVDDDVNTAMRSVSVMSPPCVPNAPGCLSGLDSPA